MPEVINLLDDDAVDWLIKEIDRVGAHPALIVFDTVAWAMIGGEENSAKDVGRMLAAMRQLRERYGACVLGIHHSGKDAARGSRGSSAFEASIDTLLRVDGREGKEKLAIGDPATLISHKDKENEGFHPIHFTTAEVKVNIPGGTAFSLVVTRYHGGRTSHAPEAPSVKEYSDNGVLVWKTLNKLCGKDPKGATFTAWKVAVLNTGKMTEGTFKNAREALLKGGWVVENPADDKLYLSTVPGQVPPAGGQNAND